MCPTTERAHYQCYIQFKRKSKHTAICTLFNLPKGKTIQAYSAFVAYGSLEQNLDYCSKDATRAAGTTCYRFGTPFTGEPGKRNDIKEYCDKIKTGASKRQLAEQYPHMMLKYARGTDSLQHALSKPRDSTFKNIVLVYSGGTGTGKTTKAKAELRARYGDNYYIHEGATYQTLDG